MPSTDPTLPKTLDAVEAELASTRKDFNAAIDFAIKQGMGADMFLQAWREGAWEEIKSEWPEFELPAAAAATLTQTAKTSQGARP